MQSFNKVMMIGNLTRSPEMKEFATGQLTKFSIATNRKFKKNNELQEEVCFVDVVVWGNQAKSCAEYLHKGSSVHVEGRLKLETWTHEGQNKSKHLIVAESVTFLDKKKDAEHTSAEKEVSKTRTQYSEDF